MSDLLETIEDGVATLTLNRPESLNAMSGEMMDGMKEAIPRLMNDRNVGVIVITGAGRGFCAGGDVKGMTARNSGSDKPSGPPPTLEDRIRGLRDGMDAVKHLHEGPKPTIAMMRGPAAGAGLSLALACDIRIASETVRMTTAFANVGASGDYGGSYFLPRLVGVAKARELFFTAAKVDAAEGLRLGMVNQVVPDEELEARTMALAHQLGNGPKLAYEYMKFNLNASEHSSLDHMLDLEAKHMTRTMMTEDHMEAAMAFVEKRAPNFKGR